MQLILQPPPAHVKIKLLVPRVIKHVKAASNSIYWREKIGMWSEHYKNVDSGTKQGTYGEVCIPIKSQKAAIPGLGLALLGWGPRLPISLL